jgi:hypothetical protein
MAMPDNISTLNKKKQPRPNETASAKTPAPTEKKSKPPRGKNRRRLVTGGGVLLVLILLVALLPTILVHTPMLGAIVRRSARLDGTISFQSASLGWFSSTSINGITIRDPQGETVLEADKVTCNRALLGLLFSSSNLGKLRIEKPKLSAKLSHEGSNVETVLAKWLNCTSGSSSSTGTAAGVDLSLEVADGEAAIVDQDTQQNWHVSNLQLALDLSRRLAWPARIEGSAAVDDPSHPGSLTVKSQIKPSDTPPANPGAWLGLAGTEGDFTLQASSLPLGMFRRFAARVPGFAKDGTFDANLTAQWTAADGAKLTYRGDIAQLRPLIDAATGNSGLRLAGRLTGNAAIQQSEGNIVCKAESDVEQLAVDVPNGQSFQDPHVHCVAQCSYQTADGMLKIDQTAFQFSGGNFYGFQIGPGELKTRLTGGTLQAEPLQVSCNQGTLTMQPELRMAARPMEFRLAASKLADHVQLDAAVCRSALKYVVPIIASATQSQGQFSIELDGCRIPLGDLPRAEIGGRVIVHSATMTPGPIVEQLTPMLSTPPTLVHIPPETVIDFRMTEGRIYHKGLVLALPEGQVSTFGSVGLDDSVKIMVEFSVPLSWLPKSAVTDAIRKQKLQVPMGGTLDAPRIDFAELARVKNQVLGNLARGVLQGGVGELGNQLDRLIKPGH